MATNVKYLKENNLFEAHEHFMRLSEAYIPTVLPEEEIDEDGEDMQGPNAMGGQDPNAMGGADPNGMGGQGPNAMGGADPMADMGMNDPMGEDPMSEKSEDDGEFTIAKRP